MTLPACSRFVDAAMLDFRPVIAHAAPSPQAKARNAGMHAFDATADVSGSLKRTIAKPPPAVVHAPLRCWRTAMNEWQLPGTANYDLNGAKGREAERQKLPRAEGLVSGTHIRPRRRIQLR
jgi:hypothetical protein